MKPSLHGWISRSAVGVSLAGIAGLAQASNETHERTPVVWDGAAECGVEDADVVCGLVVDRSTDSSWHLPYGIPFEDTDVSIDEVIDSRRHQFFALCRQPPPALERPPTWISDADVQAAGDVTVCTTPMDEGPEECGPLVDPADVDPEDVLETNAEWSGCWHRITADDARRPITCAMAEPGVDWDLTGVPVGVYVIEGYTWEPALNLWSQRPGFVKVLDDPGDVDQDLPAVALLELEGDGIVYSEDTVELSGCTDALPGSTFSAEWGILPNGPGEPTWQSFVEGQVVDDGALSVELEVPVEAEGSFLLVRVTVEDPMQRRFVAYLPRELGVLPGQDCPEDGGGIIADPNCEDGGSDSTESGASAGTDSSDGGTETGAAAGDAGSGGCGCVAPEQAPTAGWIGLAVLCGARTRRRTCRI